jgi:phosphoribosylformylglycinamidine synthase
MSAEILASRFRFAVNILPKDGILDPQGRAVEQSLPHLGLAGIGEVRVGRRVELAVDAPLQLGRWSKSLPASCSATR